MNVLLFKICIEVMTRSLQFPILLHSKPYARSVLCYFTHENIGFVTGISLKKTQTNKNRKNILSKAAQPPDPNREVFSSSSRAGCRRPREQGRERDRELGWMGRWHPGAVPGAERGATADVALPHSL